MSKKIIIEDLLSPTKHTTIPALVPARKAQELNLACKEVGDIAIVCRKFENLFNAPVDLESFSKVAHSDDSLITKAEASFAGFSEEELFSNSFGNLQELQKKDGNFEMDFTSVSSVLGTPEDTDVPTLFVLKYSSCSAGGAVFMTQNEVLQQAGTQFYNNFWIIPSSTDEVLIIPYIENVVREGMQYQKMLREANTDPNIVPEEKYLSNHVYFYNWINQKLYMFQEDDPTRHAFVEV